MEGEPPEVERDVSIDASTRKRGPCAGPHQQARLTSNSASPPVDARRAPRNRHGATERGSSEPTEMGWSSACVAQWANKAGRPQAGMQGMEAEATTGGSHAGCCTPGEGANARVRPDQGEERSRGPRPGAPEATGTQRAVGDDDDGQAGLAAPRQQKRQHTSAASSATEGGRTQADRDGAATSESEAAGPPPQLGEHGRRRTRPATQQASEASAQHKAQRQDATRTDEAGRVREKRQRARVDAVARGAQAAEERTSRHLRICQLAAARGHKVEEEMRTTTVAFFF